jgi:hypothetical protein
MKGTAAGTAASLLVPPGIINTSRGLCEAMISSYVVVTTIDWPKSLGMILGIVDIGAFFSPMTSKCMDSYKSNDIDRVSGEKIESAHRTLNRLFSWSVLKTSTTLKASRAWKPGYTSTPKWTGRAEVFVIYGRSSLVNAVGRVPSRVIMIVGRILYSSRVWDAITEIE